MLQHVKNIVVLIGLQLVLDRLFIFLYPSVNPVRATLIGFGALVILFLPLVKHLLRGYRIAGFLSIYSSALFGALLVQAGILVSKSPLSAAAHVAILIATYSAFVLGWRLFKRENR